MGITDATHAAKSVYGLKQSAWMVFQGFEVVSRIDKQKWLFKSPRLFEQEFQYQVGKGYFENLPLLTDRERAKLKAIEKRLLSMDF